MRSLKNIFLFETKSLFNLKTFLVIIVFLLLAILIIMQGIALYSGNTKQCDEFHKLELNNTGKNIKSIQSGLIGTRLFNSLLKQTPVSSLFHGSALFDTLHSTLDNSGILLEIVSKSSKNIPEKQSGLFSGMSRYIIFVLGFLAALTGLFAGRDKARIKFLLNMGGRFSVCTGLFLSRLLYVLITLVLLLAAVFLCFIFKGVPLGSVDIKLILVNFFAAAVVLAFFLLAGLMAGLTNSMFKGALVVIAAWMIVIFILPGAINGFCINPLIKNLTSVRDNDTQKLEILSNFEDMVKEKVKKYKSSEWKQLSIDMNKQFLNIEYEKIKKLEAEMIRESEAVVKKICFINMFSPGTFYESVSGEMTVGYRALLDFHKFNFEKQRRIVEFYIKSYFDKSAAVPDIPVVYQLKSRLPFYFIPGLLLNILLVLLAFALFYFCFSRAMFPRVRKDFKGVKIKAQKGDYFLLKLSGGGADFSNKIFNTFFKPKGESFTGEITVANRGIPDLAVFYLPGLKDMKPSALRLLSGGDSRGFEKKPFARLTYAELLKLFPQIGKSDILFIDNAGISLEPQQDIVILDLDTSVSNIKYTKMYFISLDRDAFEVRVSKDNSG